MDGWGESMLRAVTSCAQMAAIGWGMPRDAISQMMEWGPHLLAPTASDLTKHTQVGLPLAGWHNDLNLLTIHGRSRYPGLHAWLRDGSRVPVSIPEGCLLVQAGQQMEHLTAGAVQAGMHEVVVTAEAVGRASRAVAAGRPGWRISSTLFAHVASSRTLAPLPPFARAAAAAAYPPTQAGEQVMGVLRQIKLFTPHAQA